MSGLYASYTTITTTTIIIIIILVLLLLLLNSCTNLMHMSANELYMFREYLAIFRLPNFQYVVVYI